MNNPNRTLHLFMMLISVLSTVIFAAIPRIISYQGVLTDSDGNPLQLTGQNTITFSLYADSTSTAALWSEEKELTLQNGFLATMLGNKTPFPATLDFNAVYYLGISIDGNDELKPRVAFSAVPYAFRAVWADSAQYAKNIPPLSENTISGSHIVDHSLDSADLPEVYKAPKANFADSSEKTDHAVNADTATYAKNMDGASIADGSIEGAKIKDSTINGVDIDPNTELNVSQLSVNGQIYMPVDSNTPFIIGGARLRSNGYGGFRGLSFDTYNGGYLLDRIFINGNGNVGIGTESPQVKLHVVGDQLYVQGNASNSIAAFDINNSGNGPIALLRGNGNIGIGTTDPNAKLDIRGSVQIANSDYVLGSTGSCLTLGFGAISGNTYASFDSHTGGGTAFGDIVFHPTGNGNVGIGTTSPEYTLDVNGPVNASGALTENGNRTFSAGSMFESAEQTITPNADISVSHGLGGIPKLFLAVCRCVIPEFGYAVDDEVMLPLTATGNHEHTSVYSNSTSIGYVTDNASLSGIRVMRRDVIGLVDITPSNWRLVFRAWR